MTLIQSESPKYNARLLVKKIYAILFENEGYKIYAPAMKFCTDNASMIASSAYFLANTVDNLDVEVFSRMS